MMPFLFAITSYEFSKEKLTAEFDVLLTRHSRFPWLSVTCQGDCYD